MTARRPTRGQGAAAAVAAGLLWLVLWAHQLAAHGTTEVNERKIVLGLTWLDSAKFYVLPFALALVGLVAAHRARREVTSLGRAAFALTVVALLGLVVGTAVEFWPSPWGSYADGEEGSGILHAAASILFTAALLPFAVGLVRARVLPWWAAAALALAAPATIFLSPAYPVPGLAWLVLGAVLGRSATRRSGG